MAKKTRKKTSRAKRGIVAFIETFDRLGNDDDPYFWRAKGHNGEIIFPSEGYDKADDRDDTAHDVARQLRVPVREEAK